MHAIAKAIEEYILRQTDTRESVWKRKMGWEGEMERGREEMREKVGGRKVGREGEIKEGEKEGEGRRSNGKGSKRGRVYQNHIHTDI